MNEALAILAVVFAGAGFVVGLLVGVRTERKAWTALGDDRGVEMAMDSGVNAMKEKLTERGHRIRV
jgi:hypothetical protein